MLRHVTIFTAVLVLAWWARGGDAQSLKRDFLQFTAARTQFTPDEASGGSDWGS